jgi:hypothetical protein
MLVVNAKYHIFDDFSQFQDQVDPLWPNIDNRVIVVGATEAVRSIMNRRE